MIDVGSSEIHVWVCHVGGAPPEALSRELADLEPAERSRADRMRPPADRARFVAAHAALKRLLSRYLALPPSDIELDAAPGGKPRLSPATLAKTAADLDLRFNLSHSGDLAAVAVSRRDVGVDLEREQPVRDWTALSAHVCSLEERQVLDRQADAAGIDRAFNRIWVRKEAFVKATGTGLAADLTGVTVLPLESPTAPVIGAAAAGADGRRWSVHDIAVGPGYAGAVATDIDRPTVLVRHISQ